MINSVLTYVDNAAESLEIEATYGPSDNQARTRAYRQAALLLRRAEALLKPWAEAEPAPADPEEAPEWGQALTEADQERLAELLKDVYPGAPL